MHKRIWFLLALVGGLLLAACRGNAAPTPIPPFVGPVWEWVGTSFTAGSTLGVPDPTQYTIHFQGDGMFVGKADCNNIGGTYTVNSNTLAIKLGPSSLAACPPGSLDQQYLSQLAAAVSYLFHTNELSIFLANNTGAMHFRAAGSAPATPLPVTAAPTTIPTKAPPTAVPTKAPPSNTPPPACAGLPQIEFFIAEPATIVRGQNSVLRWGKVNNANTVVIDQGIGGVATPGTFVVAPATTTTYIMTAIGCGGQVQASTTVTVIQPTAPPAPTQPPPTAKPTQPPPPTPTPTQPPPPTAIPTQPVPTTQPGAELLGLWKWTGLRLQDGSTIAPPNPNQYTITFNSNGTANIQADCNQAQGTWNVSGNYITIQIASVTTALCGDDSYSDRYLLWLGQANTYSVQGAVLLLDLAQDTGRMTLSR